LKWYAQNSGMDERVFDYGWIEGKRKVELTAIAERVGGDLVWGVRSRRRKKRKSGHDAFGTQAKESCPYGKRQFHVGNEGRIAARETMRKQPARSRRYAGAEGL
jgi:hypothetical protein